MSLRSQKRKISSVVGQSQMSYSARPSPSIRSGHPEVGLLSAPPTSSLPPYAEPPDSDHILNLKLELAKNKTRETELKIEIEARRRAREEGATLGSVSNRMQDHLMRSDRHEASDHDEMMICSRPQQDEDLVSEVLTRQTDRSHSSKPGPNIAERSSASMEKRHLLRPRHDRNFDVAYVDRVKSVLAVRGENRQRRLLDYATSAARRVKELLDVAQPPTESEALFLTGVEAAGYVASTSFFGGPIITEGQQPLPLQTPEEFLDEFYNDDAPICVQDSTVKVSSNQPHVRTVTVAAVRERFAEPSAEELCPWNCLELACHHDDGIRPSFLNVEDCRLLTKLKGAGDDSVGRRTYSSGMKEVEKWALLAQGGALTEPHQDSHGYSTYITVNTGPIGYGWLSKPSDDEREAWQEDPFEYIGGRWRYIILQPGQTVYFPAGTIHFVFRHPEDGNTLAYGGHVLRCSQIVRWVRTMIAEKANPQITNEDLSEAAIRYLNRVEAFVNQARRKGQEEKWGGEKCIVEFLRLKDVFMEYGKKKSVKRK